MKFSRIASIAVLSAVTVGVAAAQDFAGKKTGPALKAQPKKAGQESRAPQTYGTTSTSFYRMGGSEFTAMQVGGPASADAWNDTWYSSSDIRRFPQVASGWFIGTPHLPSGAIIKNVYIENCVADGTIDSMGGAVYACENDGDNCASIGNLNSVTGCGYDTIDVSAANYVVNNAPGGNYLVIFISMLNTDGTDSLAGAVVEYQLQVSPAPAVATFPDVPTSDFGYQFVEALVASGITGGCGGGLYCPDNFVTRRQMAIFIAKALGLHFQ